MATFHFDTRYFSGKKLKWVSFESTPSLESTKQDIYGKCVPCISNLYDQLREGKQEVCLGPAFDCWKVTVILDSVDACLELLDQFEKRFLGDRKIKGRFGSNDESKTTTVMVFAAASEQEKERLLDELSTCVQEVRPDAEVSAHKGCVELYHELFGDWRMWEKTVPVIKPEAVGPILDRIRRVLFWEKG